MRLKELRKQNNLSQQEIAKMLGITDGGYSSYETGRTEPSIDMLIRLADYYEVSIDYLIGRTNTISIKTNKEEPEILSLYRELEAPQQGQLIGIAKGMLIATGRPISSLQIPKI